MKRLFKAGIFILFLSKIVFSQIPQITQFTAQDTTVSHLYSSIIELDNGDLFMIWIESGHLKISYSYDGINWTGSRVLLSDISEDLSLQDLAAYKTTSGKVLIAYRSSAEITEYHIISSTDNGMNWSLPALLIKDLTGNANKRWDIKFSQTDDNKLWFTFVINSDIGCITSKDDGVTWSDKKILTSYAKYGNVISVGDSLMLIFERDYNILSRTSSDSGNTCGTIDTIFNENKYNYEPSVVKKSDGSLMLIFRTSNFSALGDYYFIESVDDGKTWSSSTQFTKYSGIDSKLRINTNSENMFACFVSARSFNETDFEKRSISYTIWYGIVGVSDDIYTPPVINEITHSPDFPNSQDTIIFNAEVFDDEYVTHVFLKYKLNDIEQTPIEMFDDGLHYDGQPDDSVYGIIIDSLSIHDQLVYSIAAEDNRNNNSERFGDSIYIDIPYTYRSYLIDINRFKLPLDNQGVLADVKENGQYSYGGRFDSLSVLYSGGFALSGYKDGEIWGNEMFTTSRITDYLPGIVGGDKDNANNKVYILKSSDEPFGPSWQVWKYAVSLGAKFYDGDGDGVYNPIDINRNGIWDENEDHPDLIGDVTAWTVFNDGVPEDLRSYQVSPKDIEIKQTVFGYASKTHEELDGILFVRYNIENKSTEVYDSVYFSVMADPDIGDYVNDLTGCDTTINSGFAYDKEDDKGYGNSPTVMVTLLQGAPVYIPGETFIDNNNNGIYDDGIDTPLDTAFYKYGKLLTEHEFPGAKNQNITSFMHYISSHPTMGDPDNKFELRNYQTGYMPSGKKIDPCNWEFGEVFNVNCSNVNPVFMYSGDPVTQNGWINTFHADQRIMLNTGPYTLKPNEPIEIITAYVVGRGNTSLESVNVTKKLAKNALGFYSTNFAYVPIGVSKKPNNQLPTEYSLSQNYPNPFNPSTTIRYSIPTTGQAFQIVQLKVYDILGREIATLVNKHQKSGNYEVQFDVKSVNRRMSSGVYFYTLKSGKFLLSKKMILLK